MSVTFGIHDRGLDGRAEGGLALRQPATGAERLTVDEQGSVVVEPAGFTVEPGEQPDQSVAPWPAGRRAALEVDQRVHLEGPAPQGAVVRVGFLRRPASLDRAAFGAHWNDRHVPLVLRSGPRFVRYVTNVVTGVVLPDGRRVPSRWDGIVLQWFPSEAALEVHDREVRRGAPDVAADIERFVAEFTSYVCEELP